MASKPVTQPGIEIPIRMDAPKMIKNAHRRIFPNVISNSFLCIICLVSKQDELHSGESAICEPDVLWIQLAADVIAMMLDGCRARCA